MRHVEGERAPPCFPRAEQLRIEQPRELAETLAAERRVRMETRGCAQPKGVGRAVVRAKRNDALRGARGGVAPEGDGRIEALDQQVLIESGGTLVRVLSGTQNL